MTDQAHSQMAVGDAAHADRLFLATAAMGTRFELVLMGDDHPRMQAAGEAAVREIVRWHERLSRFVPGSDVSRLNRDRAGRVDGELLDLLGVCEQVWKESDGAFDIAAASRAVVAIDVREPSYMLDRATTIVRLADWAMLDLGAVGKGLAVDVAATVLREAGVEAALIHGGTSSVFAIGRPRGGDARGWGVQIRSAGAPKCVWLRDSALGVTAAAGHRGEMGDHDARGLDRPHLVDPVTGEILGSNRVDTAVVIGPSATLCDAWSTALAVLAARDGECGWAAAIPAAYESHLHGPLGWRSYRTKSGAAAE